MRIGPLLALGLGLCAPLIVRAADAPRPTVTTTAGVLRGFKPDGAPGAVFKGVPFAQPPVGPLRWHEPLPALAWSGVKDASVAAPACAQISREGPTSREDCLYLNVWTPEWPLRGPHPVMLWLFGGANVVGSASMPGFDGAALARRGVVVVAANYRVGVMGFLAHPALSAESSHGSSGDYALLDQIMALRWIHENAARFGGDPANVTVFGQSAGAYDILLLMASPLARGLFQHAIAESGQILSFGGSMPKAKAEQIGLNIAADLKAPVGPGALAYLRALPADQVMAAAAKHMPTGLTSDTGLLTNVDGWVLPQSPARVFAEGREAPVDLMIGNNAREITLPGSLDDLRRQIADKYGPFAPQALKVYGLADGGPGVSDPLLGGAGAQWMTDTVQRCAASMEADWHAAAGHRTWRYQFELPVPGREAMGSTHAAEIPYVFGNLGGGADSPPYGAVDRQVSTEMQDYWTRFAATGDPNGPNEPAWPRAGDGRYLAFTPDGPKALANLQAGPCAVFRQWALSPIGPAARP
ncbi:MAG TPA: carboxylesterase family protein [Caulobacteraceae bacterium]|nr:carboxylesterase family protein [Caulobacteraceae bacterium]